MKAKKGDLVLHERKRDGERKKWKGGRDGRKERGCVYSVVILCFSFFLLLLLDIFYHL